MSYSEIILVYLIHSESHSEYITLCVCVCGTVGKFWGKTVQNGVKWLRFDTVFPTVDRVF
jgi:hypothetical protein